MIKLILRNVYQAYIHITKSSKANPSSNTAKRTYSGTKCRAPSSNTLASSNLSSSFSSTSNTSFSPSSSLTSSHSPPSQANSSTNHKQRRYNMNYFLKMRLKPFLISIAIILVYYLFSITLTFYNRMIFVTYKYPLSITMIHLIIKFLLSMIIRNILTCFSSQSRILLNWDTYWKRIVPTGIASAIDIGLSNWSLQYITISLYTMSKSTVILFIFFLSILFKLEKWNWSLVLVSFLISLGLLLFTFHSTEFHLFGFILVMLASFSSGLRWTLAQVVTQKHELGLSNPIDMIYHIQPTMILALVPLASYVEGVHVVTSDKFFRTDDIHVLLSNMSWILLGAFIAFLLESSEYLVVTYTSSITLSISGIFKEICIIYLAVTINHNQLNTMNTIGLVVCLLGISIHVFMKARQQIIKPDDDDNPNGIISLRRIGSHKRTSSNQLAETELFLNSLNDDYEDYSPTSNTVNSPFIQTRSIN